MCGGSFARGRVEVGSGRRRGPFGMDVEEMSPGARVAVALAVLGVVALSGVFLVVFVPGLWWIFTTYFWVSFPALGMLGSGIAGFNEATPARVSKDNQERELLETLRERGEISAAAVAVETSMTVSEADRKLRELAEGGHLEVRVRGGALLYALWESGRDIESAR
jgi:hypothetical protein